MAVTASQYTLFPRAFEQHRVISRGGPQTLHALLQAIDRCEDRSHTGMLRSLAGHICNLLKKEPQAITIEELTDLRPQLRIHLQERRYKPHSVRAYVNFLRILVRAGEKLDQERRVSGGPWRSKNRPPDICLRKWSEEGTFRGIPEGCTQWSYMHEFGERFMWREKANGK